LPGHDIMVIGGSAGALQTLLQIVGGLPADLPASVLVVLHGSPAGAVLLPELVARASKLMVRGVETVAALTRGCIFLAAPDRHLLLGPNTVVAGKGPRENGFRPAIDPLFRTAALRHGPRVVGLILSGMLDDGSLGLALVKGRGGIAIVQDPAEALYPDMPTSALTHVAIDHLARADDIPALLVRLSAQAPAEPPMPPLDDGPDVAEKGSDGLNSELLRTPPSPFTCPECGGVLWDKSQAGIERYVCHTGHSFTPAALVNDQQPSVEEAMWSALRTLQEGIALRRRMAERAVERGAAAQSRTYLQEAQEYERQADAIRELLLGRAPRDTPAKHES
jgi:two-component system chemotaxis response regulator CheB